MRKVFYVLFSLLTVSLVIAHIPLNAFAADLLETHVECEVNDFMEMNGEKLRDAMEYFINMTDVDLFVAVRSSLNGEADVSDQTAREYLFDRYSDFLGNQERGALVVMLLPEDSESGWRIYSAENALSFVSELDDPPFQIYFDEYRGDGKGTEESLADAINLLADGIVFGDIQPHAVEYEEYTLSFEDPYEFDPGDPYYGLTPEEYEAFSEMVPDFSVSTPSAGEALLSGLPKALIGTLAAVLKIFLKKAKSDKEE